VNGAAAAALMVGGTAFGVASSIPDPQGVVHGCYSTNGAAVTNGTPLNIIDSTKANCSKNQTAISWNAAGRGATVTSLAPGNSNCPSGGAEIQDGNPADSPSYACNGAQGPAGPSVTTLTGLACTTDGGAAGTVSTSTDSKNAVVLTCTALSTDANCSHSDGLGDTYTDCNDLLGTPGDAATYNQPMAFGAAAAYAAVHSTILTYFINCQQLGNNDEGSVVQIQGSPISPGYVSAYFWVIAGPDAGLVFHFLNAANSDDVCTTANSSGSNSWT
jgi:hypothetical protein